MAKIKELVELTKGHPGAAVVLNNLIENYGDDIMRLLRDQKIEGPDLHFLYKACNQSITTTYQVLDEKKAVEMLRDVRDSSFFEPKTIEIRKK